MADESNIQTLHYLTGPPPAGAVVGQVVAVPAYVYPPPADGSIPPRPEVPPGPGKVPNAVALLIEWAGGRTVGLGGKRWEG